MNPQKIAHRDIGSTTPVTQHSATHPSLDYFVTNIRQAEEN